MRNHRFILEPYRGLKSRFQCPTCQHKEKSFTLYIDAMTREYIHSKVGRCNREVNCGYHYTPKQFFQEQNISGSQKKNIDYPNFMLNVASAKPSVISYISDDIFRLSLDAYDHNYFISFLISRFGIERTTQVINQYFIGTSKHWPGSTVFWQIDVDGKVRTGKIILYSPTTGKRVKEPRPYISWVHSALSLPGFNLKQILFGEHLLKNNTLPCALVESEKSAIISSLYFPEFIWLATGSLNNLSEDRCEVLKGRRVILFPDLKGYDRWMAKASVIKCFTDYSILDLLERNATESEKQSGLDIADYLLKCDLKDFNKQNDAAHEKISTNIDIDSENKELPFEETQLYENLMYDMTNKYFGHPLLPKLRLEKPLSIQWNAIYQHIRFAKKTGQ